MGVAQERLGKRVDSAGANAEVIVGAGRRQDLDRADAHGFQKADGLLLDHIGQSTNQQQLPFVGFGQHRDHRGEAGVFALGERRLYPRAREVQHADRRCVALGHPFGGLGEVKLDHLRGAGAHQEQLFDVGAAGQKFVHHLVQLVLGVGEACQISLFKDRRSKARFSKNHHASGGLEEVGAGSRAYHQKECVLHFAVQPDDSRQAAEHLALATLFENRRIAATAMAGEAGQFGHAGTSFGVAA
mmetsp:Transcript_18552/g.30583  ORF Transcript_18552/g.30583 Transcript_18552/m.30583 type:complete len:243 (-) Transcript_18552:868-1596(-)